MPGINQNNSPRLGDSNSSTSAPSSSQPKQPDSTSTTISPQLIESVKTPLALFALAILVIQAIMMYSAIAIGGIEGLGYLQLGTVAIILVVILVAGISIKYPEALWGRRFVNLNVGLAHGLGTDLIYAFDGVLDNLPQNERRNAYLAFCTLLRKAPYITDESQKEFCDNLKLTIEGKLDINRDSTTTN